jgi:hypothetical protein
MAVVIQPGFVPYVPPPPGSTLATEGGDTLVTEAGDALLVDPGVAAPPLSHPRIGWRALSGAVSASSEAPGFAADFAATPQTYTAWRPTGAASESWAITLSGPDAADYCGIGAHNLGSLGASVAVEQWDGAAWQPVASHAPADDSAILFLFERVSSSQFRIVVTGAAAPPRIGNVRFGIASPLPRKSTFAPALPITEAEELSYNVNVSATGEWLGRSVVSAGLRFSVTVDHMPETYAAGEWAQFRRYCNEGEATFYVAPKPQAYPAECAYAWPQATVRAERSIPNKGVSRTTTLELAAYRGHERERV